MPHDLNIVGGQASMMYVGETPWHGLGTQLDKPASAAEAISAAKLRWRVSKKLLYARDGNKASIVEDHYAVVREDRWPDHPDSVLGLVGSQYTPLQNLDAFTFFDPIVGQNAAVYHTAGALGSGERVWIMAKLPSDIRVIGDDITHKYLLLSNSHDGNSAVQIKFTPVRVVCQNTLTLALKEGPTLRIPHSREMNRRLAETAALLRAIQVRFDQVEETFKAMATRQIDQGGLKGFVNEVFPEPRRQDDEERYERAMAQLWTDRAGAEYLFDQGHGNTSGPGKGTLWAAYNGVTEYIDHRRYNSLPIARRWDQLWFGMGYSAKKRAYQVATDMVRK